MESIAEMTIEKNTVYQLTGDELQKLQYAITYLYRAQNFTADKARDIAQTLNTINVVKDYEL